MVKIQKIILDKVFIYHSSTSHKQLPNALAKYYLTYKEVTYKKINCPWIKLEFSFMESTGPSTYHGR